MQVTLNKIVPLDDTVEKAWKILKDIEQVAGCMPGAEITEVIDENNYKGSVKVKIGPMNVAFKGEINVLDIDSDAHQIHLIAKGQDSKGTSSASMDLTARVRTNESGASELTGDAAVTVNGKLANFGGRMMTQVADQILGQFADNFSQKLASSSTDSGSEEPVASKPVEEINGLKFAWNAIIGVIKSFFQSRK
ncbi:MAG: SRPBCC family protein [Gammaproteobacteria bacterium]|nr:SRPBCC family protein [Gammaproteobacteria bacterium]